MTTVEALKAGRMKIANKKHWTQKAAARDRQGNAVTSVDQSAVCWCTAGALTAVVSEWGYRRLAISFLDARMEGRTRTYNDNHTHAEVLAAWDAAIADAEKAVA